MRQITGRGGTGRIWRSFAVENEREGVIALDAVLEEERRWKFGLKDFRRALLLGQRRLHPLFCSAKIGISGRCFAGELPS